MTRQPEQKINGGYASKQDISTQSADVNGRQDPHGKTEPQRLSVGREKALSEPMCRWLDEPAKHGPYNNLAGAEWSNREVEALDALGAPKGISTPESGKGENKKH